jgi:hypothetical protein
MWWWTWCFGLGGRKRGGGFPPPGGFGTHLLEVITLVEESNIAHERERMSERKNTNLRVHMWE